MSRQRCLPALMRRPLLLYGLVTLTVAAIGLLSWLVSAPAPAAAPLGQTVATPAGRPAAPAARLLPTFPARATPAATPDPLLSPTARPTSQTLMQLPPLVPDAPEPLPPLVFARQGQIWRSDGSARPPRQLTRLSAEQYAEQPAIAPDGGRIAFITMTQPPLTATASLPLWALVVMDADGSDLRVLWAPHEAQLVLPAWSADGAAIYVMYNGMQGTDGAELARHDLRVVRVDLANGAQRPVVENAMDPAVSPDGAHLAYVRLSEDGFRMTLEVAGLDGAGPRALIDSPSFEGFYAPRFSPDGQRIVVAAIGGLETDEQGYPIRAAAPSPLDRLLGLFAPPAAQAHGVPWDLWVVNIDGSGLRRLTKFYEDLPMAAFSPDGDELVVMAYGGFYRMDADGGRLRRIDPLGDHGGVAWAR